MLARGIGVRFRGVERRDVEEYCVSEQWIRAAAGKALDRRGQPLVIKMTGAVEPYFLAPPAGDEAIQPKSSSEHPFPSPSGRRWRAVARRMREIRPEREGALRARTLTPTPLPIGRSEERPSLDG